MDLASITSSAIVFVVFIIVALGFYYMMSRKALKSREAHFRDLHTRLAVGQYVLLSDGIYGSVKKVGEERVDVEIASHVVITVSRFAIAEIVEK